MATVTLRQVAEQADVSIGTASHALNNHPSVAPETRARVMDVAIALGYRLRGVAEKVPAATTDMAIVGLLTKHDRGEPVVANDFYFHVQAGVESECRHQHISLMVANVEVDSSNRPVAWPVMIRNRQVHGLLLMGASINNTVDWVQREANIPIVLVDSYAAHLPYDSVVTDNVGGAFMAVNHLLQLGHRRIGLVGANHASFPSVQERRAGYVQALRTAGIDHTWIEETLLSQQDGYQGTKRLLENSPDVTAIFACNDHTALGVLDAAREMGRRVPQDLSVVGFDNIDLAAETQPALTTVHIHKTWMGIIGLRKLLERARDPDQPKTTTMLSTQLRVRGSTCPPRS